MADKREGPSPEEQLLNIIEKGEVPGNKILKRKKVFSLVDLFLGVFSALRIDSLLKAIKIGLLKRPKIEFVNKVIIVLGILIAGYSVFDFIFNKKDADEFYKKIAGPKNVGQEEGTKTELLPFLHYLALVQQRDIFSPLEMVKDVEKAEQKEKEDTLQTLVSGIKLVGISWGDEPQAMIENEKTKQTYFIKKGEVINNLKIEEILKNKVILSYEGKKVELI